MTSITVRDDGRSEWPNASTLALARLVCEHGSVVWVCFGPANVKLTTEQSEGRQQCPCLTSITLIYPEAQKEGA